LVDKDADLTGITAVGIVFPGVSDGFLGTGRSAFAFVICVPAAVTEIAAPFAEDARVFFRLMPSVPELDTLIETCAIAPFGIALIFGPLAIQPYPPALAAHVTVLPAAVNCGPAVTERMDMFEG
jgi:hypothetical protein